MNFIKHLGLCLVLGFAVLSTGCSKNDEQGAGTEADFLSAHVQKTYTCPDCSASYIATRNAMLAIGGGPGPEAEIPEVGWELTDENGDPYPFFDFRTQIWWTCPCRYGLMADANSHDWELIP